MGTLHVCNYIDLFHNTKMDQITFIELQIMNVIWQVIQYKELYDVLTVCCGVGKMEVDQ